jgi:hypothetical protein
VPEPPKEPVTRLGELWLLGEHRLLCGDATVLADVERVLGGTLADMAWTDPPYNVDYLGDRVLVGPNAHVVGATVEDEVFIATGAAVFHGSRLGRGSEVRVNSVVHLKTELPPGKTVPIGWIACGTPAQLFSPDQHDALWAVQKPLNFPLTVYGFDRDAPDLMRRITQSPSGSKHIAATDRRRDRRVQGRPATLLLSARSCAPCPASGSRLP